jgi:LmbE family N-acetylglucosaminyl deacetylase
VGRIDAGRARFTVVSFHAHPDDESWLTGGTLARAASEGHRVVLVTATDGERGLAGVEDGVGSVLARRRAAELAEAAHALGVHRIDSLGYGDSGLRPAPDDSHAFAHADVEEAAERLARLLVRERADVLTIYDANGGYGHPDHVQVHHVGVRAAQLAGTPVVLEATAPAELFRAALWVMRLAGHALGRNPPLGKSQIFTTRRLLTHRVRVKAFLPAKRAALAAHGSQRRAAGQGRVLDWTLRLPGPVFTLAFGREWFVEHGRRPGRLQQDIFVSLLTAARTRS